MSAGSNEGIKILIARKDNHLFGEVRFEYRNRFSADREVGPAFPCIAGRLSEAMYETEAEAGRG